eukprot:Blabericola_migrator_1__3508@NODE_203_length_11435_cov_141_633445_g174_i0_p5_GENE_NODE_203_length_11435_cov_141_633445_g174_i0NODE_203_length_11435_cov_141_633445_g174_i0_p5_ORF_typecomplete_len400_score46_07_NODE_203_length_11435_cov_141_633445_g174_i047955994
MGQAQSSHDFVEHRIQLHYVSLRADIMNRIKKSEGRVLLGPHRVRDGSSLVKFPIYGRPSQHVPFLSPGCIERLLPFVLDKTLSLMMRVCPHWFITLHDFLITRWCKPMIIEFQQKYKTYLHLESVSLSLQPLYTEDFSIRIDLLIYAKVLNTCKKKCLEMAYTYRFMDPVSSDSYEAPKIPDAFATARRTTSSRATFRIEVLPQGASRHVWLRKDTTRFHGDEILVVGSANVPEVCCHDRIEIPINLSNGVGIIDPRSIKWAQPKFVTERDEPPRSHGQKCLLEEEASHWYDFDSYVPQSPEKISKFDLFAPHWELKSSEYTGVSIVISRSRYSVETLGEVIPAASILGLECKVLNKDDPIVVPLKRLGLEHDRFANQQIRKGDKITLYIVQGGPEAP